MDDLVSVASIPVRGRGQRSRGRGIAAAENSASSRHVEVSDELPPLQAMRDIARAVQDEIPPPPLPQPPRREMSPDPIEAKFRRYMKEFERRNRPTFTGGSDVMIVEGWL